MRSPPSGIPFFDVIFRMSFPAFSLMCSMPWLTGPLTPTRKVLFYPLRGGARKTNKRFRLVARLSRIYLVDPGEDTARQVRGRESAFPEQGHRAGAPCAGLAVDDEFRRRVELVQPSRQVAERYEPRPRDAADGRFERFAHVQNHRRRPRVDARLELPDRHLSGCPLYLRKKVAVTFFGAASDADVLEGADRRMRAADRTVGIPGQLQLPEAHPQ